MPLDRKIAFIDLTAEKIKVKPIPVTLPKRYFDGPIPEGPARGAFISRNEFDHMLNDYYRLHGWGKNGVPKKNTLKRLGLKI